MCRRLQILGGRDGQSSRADAAKRSSKRDSVGCQGFADLGSMGRGVRKTLSRMSQDGGEAQGGGHMGIDGGANTADGRKKE